MTSLSHRIKRLVRFNRQRIAPWTVAFVAASAIGLCAIGLGAIARAADEPPAEEAEVVEVEDEAPIDSELILDIEGVVLDGVMEIEADVFDAAELNVEADIAIEIDGVVEADVAPLAAIVIAADGQAPEGADDDDLEAPPVVQQPRFNVNDEQFDQWVFNQVGNAQKATERFQSSLNVQVDAIAAACDLSSEQRQKLLLAGNGDIIRFFDKVEVSRAKFKKVKNDQNRINEVFIDIQPLQLAANAGLFDENSFFHKVVKKTLTDEQSARVEQISKDRRQFQFKAKVELIVAALDDTIAMRAEQRKQLTELLMESPPPKRFGPYDSYLFLYRISRLPEEKVKKLFDPPQWRALDRQLDQARNLQPFLKQQGLLTDEDVEP